MSAAGPSTKTKPEKLPKKGAGPYKQAGTKITQAGTKLTELRCLETSLAGDMGKKLL